MRTIHYLVLLLILLGCFSCDEKKPSAAPNQQEVLTGNDTLSIGQSLHLKPALSLTPEAIKGVADWKFYSNLSKAIDSLPATTLGALKVNLKDFTKIYEVAEEAEEAEISITPDDVQTNAINARLLVIETKLNVLENFITKNEPNGAIIAEKVGEIQNAFQDLKLQLNEHFSSSLKDLLEEIKKENEEAASKKDTLN